VAWIELAKKVDAVKLVMGYEDELICNDELKGRSTAS